MIYIRKTCVLTFNKKNKIFFQNPIPKKFNGGGVSQKLTKLNTFLFWQKFLAEFSAGNFENRPSQNFVPKSSPPFVVLNLDQKKKSYVILKSVDAKFSKNAFTSPPPLKMKGVNLTVIVWHGIYLENCENCILLKIFLPYTRYLYF